MLGWTVERGAIRREVEAIALETEYYLEKRLLALETKFKNLIPPKRRSGWNRVLVELDGCQIRTGSLLSSQTEELTPLRRLKKRKRDSVNLCIIRDIESGDCPSASGEIESSHRYIPQKRLKIPGATWNPQTINPMARFESYSRFGLVV